MSYSVKPASGLGRLGEGLGEGLAQQLPKEIERVRLSKGLENLGKEDFSGGNQIQNLAKIYNIPGMTPEVAKLLQRQIIKQNFLNKKPTGAGSPSEQTLPTGTTKQEKPQTEKQENGFATPEQLKEYRQNIQRVPGYNDIKSLADDYLNQGLTEDPQEALKFAETELTQNRQAQQTRNDEFKKGLNDRLKLDLQGAGLGDFKDLAGEIQKTLVEQGEYMVNEGGLSPEEASAQLSQIALNLGKATTNLNETGSWTNMFRGSGKKETDLREQKKEFQKYGFGEIFDDMVTAKMGFTPLLTAHILDPLKNETLLKLIPKSNSPLKKGVRATDLSENQLDNIIDAIKPSDNLFSIEYELRKNHYDVNKFKKRLSKLVDEKKKALSPQQERQQKRPITNSPLGDILFETF